VPVDNPGVIDAIGLDKSTGEVVLTIADAVSWDDCTSHLLALQEKINRYIGFIEQELPEAYPQSRGRSIRIDIVCRFPPPQEGEQFLERARDHAITNRWSLSWRVHAA